MSSYLSQLLTVLVPVTVQLALFLRWLHRRVRDDEIQRAFVYDVATNHLPHNYDALHAIAEQQGITLDAPPAVRFIDLMNGTAKSTADRNAHSLDPAPRQASSNPTNNSPTPSPNWKR